jgi:hypothetical protein
MRRGHADAHATHALHSRGHPTRGCASRACGLRPEDLLPGDGYDRYLKPFRSIEDIHIQAATLAWVLREARARRWPLELVTQGAA